MIRVRRSIVSVIAFLFALSQLVLGAFYINKYDEPIYGIGGLLVFLALFVPTMLLFKGLQIPQWVAALNFAMAVMMPMMAHNHLHPMHYGTYATWHIGAIGILLGATALRGQPIYAWAGAFVAGLEIVYVEGATGIFQGGLLGMLILVLVGHITRLGISRADADIAEFTKALEAGAAQLARAEALRTAKAATFSRSLPRLEPLLKRIIAMGGKLSEEERREAMFLESEISDEIVGRALVSESIRSAARMARMRGIEIHFIDEGGLEGATSEELAEIEHQIVEIINSRDGGRIVVRATKGETWRVTVTCYPRGAVSPNLVVRL